MQNNTPSYFIFAGETSADLHGERLILALLEKNPSLRIFGVGGPRMRSAGLECILPMEAFQVMGFIDVLLAAPKLIKHFFFLRKTLLDRSPHTAIFIDYADFNMRLEASLKKKGFSGKLVHYICPSVWAWRKNRIQSLVDNLDLLLLIYPFEENYFAQKPLEVHFVGHPLIQRLREHAYQHLSFPAEKKVIALFPGSRKKELLRNFPLLLKAIKQLTPPHLHFALSLAQPSFQPLLQKMIEDEGCDLPIQFVPSSYTYELMKAAHLAIAKSGTVTLELALHEVPTLVVYELSLLDQWIAQYLFRISLPFYCIVNILLNRELFPEFIQHKIDTQKLEKAIESYLQSPEKRERCKKACREIKTLLTHKDANKEAAEHIYQL